jgi:hypothetical protein
VAGQSERKASLVGAHMAWSGRMVQGVAEKFNLFEFRRFCYFEGKPEGVVHAPSKIRNLSVTQNAPKRRMSSYHSVCNKVTEYF